MDIDPKTLPIQSYLRVLYLLKEENIELSSLLVQLGKDNELDKAIAAFSNTTKQTIQTNYEFALIKAYFDGNQVEAIDIESLINKQLKQQPQRIKRLIAKIIQSENKESKLLEVLPKETVVEVHPMSDLDIVGKSYPQIDGLQKAMGKTKFVTDLVLPGMLHGRTLRSPYPHANIRYIDTSRAEKPTGVKAVVTYSNCCGV